MTYNTLKAQAIFLWSIPGPDSTFISAVECWDNHGTLYMVQHFEAHGNAVFKMVTA